MTGFEVQFLLALLAIGVLYGAATLAGRSRGAAQQGRDAWFYTPEWQAGEREADADLAAGRTTGPMTEEEFEGLLATIGHADAAVAHV